MLIFCRFFRSRFPVASRESSTNPHVSRLLSFYFTGTGFFITQRLTTAAIFIMTVAYLALALLRLGLIGAAVFHALRRRAGERR